MFTDGVSGVFAGEVSGVLPFVSDGSSGFEEEVPCESAEPKPKSLLKASKSLSSQEIFMSPDTDFPRRFVIVVYVAQIFFDVWVSLSTEAVISSTLFAEPRAQSVSIHSIPDLAISVVRFPIASFVAVSEPRAIAFSRFPATTAA